MGDEKMQVPMTNDEYKALRKETGLTQAALVERLGVSRETVARRESGAMPINTEAALAIKALAGVKP